MRVSSNGNGSFFAMILVGVDTKKDVPPINRGSVEWQL